MKVLHSFSKYLPVTQNWAYNLIRSTPGIETYVYSNKYLLNNFYPTDITFLGSNMDGFDSLMKFAKSDKRHQYLPIYVAYKYLTKIAKEQFVVEIADNNIDIVHSHFGVEAIKRHPAVAKAKIPHVVSFYGFDYEKAPLSNPNLLQGYKNLFSSAQAFVCEGNHGASILEKYGCHPDKLHVIPLGKPRAASPPSPKVKEPGKLQLIQMAKMTEKKGHIYTLKAFKQALQKCEKMHLTFVGTPKSGADHKIAVELKQYVQENHLHDAVTFVDRIDLSELSDYLRKFDVFIHPSCYARDHDCEGGAPVVLLDAQAEGLPVIATIHCDIPDVVKDSYSGLLVSEKDVLGLAKAIERFYKMGSEKFSSFSSHAIDHVCNHYNLDNSGRLLSKLYTSLNP